MMILSTGGGKVMGSSGDLRAIARTRAEALLGVPGYVYHLLRRGVNEGADMSSVKTVVLGAERVPPGMKEKIVAATARGVWEELGDVHRMLLDAEPVQAWQRLWAALRSIRSRANLRLLSIRRFISFEQVGR